MARDGLYELLCLPAHLNINKTSYAALFSISLVFGSISWISNLASMLSLNSSSNESANVNVESSLANKPSLVDKSSYSGLRAIKEIYLWHFKLGHPNVSILKYTLLLCYQFKINKDIHFVVHINMENNENKTSKALKPKPIKH